MVTGSLCIGPSNQKLDKQDPTRMRELNKKTTEQRKETN